MRNVNVYTSDWKHIDKSMDVEVNWIDDKGKLNTKKKTVKLSDVILPDEKTQEIIIESVIDEIRKEEVG